MADDGFPDLCIGRGYRDQVGGDRHLRVIISNCEGVEKVVVASLSSKACRCGATDFIDKHEHKSLGHRSFIRCDYVLVSRLDRLQDLLKRSEIRITHRLEGEPLQRVQKRIGRGSMAPKEAKELLRQQGLIE